MKRNEISSNYKLSNNPETVNNNTIYYQCTFLSDVGNTYSKKDSGYTDKGFVMYDDSILSQINKNAYTYDDHPSLSNLLSVIQGDDEEAYELKAGLIIAAFGLIYILMIIGFIIFFIISN